MRLNPQGLGVEVRKHAVKLELLEETNKKLLREVDELKEIVHNMLLKHNPDYKKKQALDGVGDFLRNRFGAGKP